MDFGDYCWVEQKRCGGFEMHKYKVISAGKANYWRAVPVDECAPNNERGDICDVVRVIRCGFDETKVDTFRRRDVNG